MDWIRRNGDETTKAILGISSGLGPQLRNSLGYVGYKGGSEHGVLNLTWLVRRNDGVWQVITGSWNNPDAPLDEHRFVGLVARFVTLAAH